MHGKLGSKRRGRGNNRKPLPLFLNFDIKSEVKMNLIILSASYFLHFLATVVWIGGIIMILLVILPSAKTSLESAPMISGLMKEITKHFTPMANISIFILIVTGIVIAFYNKNFTNILLKFRTP